MKLSDFLLQYPDFASDDDAEDEPEDGISFREIEPPQILDPQARAIINDLVDSSTVIQVLAVLHDAFELYMDGQFIMDIDECKDADLWAKLSE